LPSSIPTLTPLSSHDHRRCHHHHHHHRQHRRHYHCGTLHHSSRRCHRRHRHRHLTRHHRQREFGRRQLQHRCRRHHQQQQQHHDRHCREQLGNHMSMVAQELICASYHILGPGIPQKVSAISHGYQIQALFMANCFLQSWTHDFCITAWSRIPLFVVYVCMLCFCCSCSFCC
jgi:hypothetical protein